MYNSFGGWLNMGRKARIPSLLGFYLVLVRGNNQESIFANDKFKNLYMMTVKKVANKYSSELVAWCLLSNCTYLIIHTASQDFLSCIMKESNSSFAVLYNQSNNRFGHVFQGRYRRDKIDFEDDLIKNIRYVHQRAIGLSNKLYKYRWSSFQEYLTKCMFISKEQRQYVLNLFNNDIKRFKEFHTIKDHNIYLKVKSLNSEQSIRVAKERIKQFCIKHNYNRVEDLRGNDVLIEELIAEMLFSGKLAYRTVSALIGVSRYAVEKVSNKIKLI